MACPWNWAGGWGWDLPAACAALHACLPACTCCISLHAPMKRQRHPHPHQAVAVGGGGKQSRLAKAAAVSLLCGGIAVPLCCAMLAIPPRGERVHLTLQRSGKARNKWQQHQGGWTWRTDMEPVISDKARPMPIASGKQMAYGH